MHWASKSPQAAYSERVRSNRDGQDMENIWSVKRPVGEVRPGDHGWLAYSGPEERDRVIGAFVNEGLNTREEKVVYVTDEPPERLPGIGPRHRLHLCDHLASGRLRVIPRERACLDSRGRFDPELMLQTLTREVDEAAGREFRAVRMTTDFSWVLSEPGRSDLAQMLGCENRFEDAVAPSTMAMAICQVDRYACPPHELAALRDTHEVLIEANPEFDDGVLRIVRTFEPHGLRVEGELDNARHTVFAEQLTRLDAARRRIHLDFAQLGFMDLGGLTLLAQHAVARPSGDVLVLDNVPPNVEAVIDMVGWHRLPDGLVRGRTSGLPDDGEGTDL